MVGIAASRHRDEGYRRAVAVVLVTGGTGTLGRLAVPELQARGHEVRVLSRRPGPGVIAADLASGAGIAQAAAGAEVVIHAASDARRFGRTDAAQTANLLAACRGVRHLVYVSIVGIDEIPYRYYRRKLDCEQLVRTSGIGHTIQRATQFHELLEMALTALGRLPVAPLPGAFLFQPVAAAEVAARLAELADSSPQGRATDFGGPQVLNLADIAASWRARYGRPRRLVPVRVPGAVARGFTEGRNTCPGGRLGRRTWAQFLQEH
jgi:uncharacterized protein YbjT (DUF2867 family)